MVSFAILFRKTLPIFTDKKLEADFTLLLEKYIFYSVLQGSTPTFDIEPKEGATALAVAPSFMLSFLNG